MTKRFKNLYFWLGILGTIVGVICATAGISPTDLQTWPAVWSAVVKIVENPFILCSVIFAVVGVVVDTSTKGIHDTKMVTGAADEAANEKGFGNEDK
jgi:phi LC3 family holin